MTTLTIPAEHTPTMKDNSYSTMACRNHPNLRWVRKNPEYMKGQISNNPQYRFDGEVGNDKIHTWNPNVGSHQLRNDESWENGDLQGHVDYVLMLIGKGYVFECECPIGDLYYIKDGG